LTLKTLFVGTTLFLLATEHSACQPTQSFGTSPFAVSHQQDSIQSKIKFIDNAFENASPFNWEVDSSGAVVISLIYDHERNSPNRANQHWHFQVQATPGTDLTFILKNFDNIWNGQKAYPISDSTPCFISEDGKKWTFIPTKLTPDYCLKIHVHMNTDKLYVASLEPYRIRDLENLLDEIKNKPLVNIATIGKTSEGRSLEIVRVGDPNVPHRIFIRARAHGFETAGNWIVQGLIRSLLQDTSSAYLRKYCLYILPMANKDAVALGRTRFNAQGMDLNRKWDDVADSVLCPENYALEMWLKQMIAQGKKPDLAIDLHNDREGNLHVSRPNKNLEQYLAHMQVFENLLYKYTWFTEGRKGGDFRNPGTIGEGLAERYGIDAFIYEFNFEWANGLKKVPQGKDWELMGHQLREVFLKYFDEIKTKSTIQK
jgi:hypothetical protein